MKVYDLENRYVKLLFICIGIFMGAGISIALLLGAVGVLPGNGDDWPIISFESFASVAKGFASIVLRFCYGGFVLLFGGLGFLAIRDQLTYYPYKVCIYDSGAVEFRRIRSSVTMNATEIHVIKKRLVQNTEEGDFRELTIQHPYGRDITINDFNSLDDFVAHLMRLNPAIVVQGSWTP